MADSLRELYVSPEGRDSWSGRLPEPNAAGTDGPLATIEAAQERIRQLARYGGLAGPITVWLRGGRYSLARPLAFTPEDAAPVTYAAYPGEEPILDGGVRITGWQESELHGQRVWTVRLPEVAAGKWYFRQLFVNGKRRPRTRLPKEGFFQMADVPGVTPETPFHEGTNTFRCAPGDIQLWRNLTDVEIVVPHFWVDERMPILSFDPETNTVVSSRTSIFVLRDGWRSRFCRYWVENVFEALGEPGEWYLDRSDGTLYYLPLPEEALEETEIFVPRLPQLLRLEGTPEEGQYVEFLSFQGLTFEHGAWYQPKGGGKGFWWAERKDYASAPQAALHVPGALWVRGARHCTFQGCTIRHIGWYGVEIAEGCHGIRLVGNEIYDLGAGGVKVLGADAQGPRALRTGYNRITDNHIYDGGHVFHSAIGVLLTHSFGNEISHNHIHDLYYSGISCGWVWGYGESVSRDNLILKNHIHHLGKGLLSDMGGIYTLGVQPGTVIGGNLIHDVERWEYSGWAVYLDEGSSHILVEGNVCYDTDNQPFHMHYGRACLVRNNIFAFGRAGQARLTRLHGREGRYRPELEEKHQALYFERNIFITEGKPCFVGGWLAPLEERGFFSDLNLFWDVSEGKVYHVTEKARQEVARRFSMEEWQALGQDRHSIVADPRCRNLAERDFTLAKDSPAFALGFQPIDLSDVGPRPSEEWEA
ncbi:MAG: right-handed parallel beta-helix repeat-containing protein [Anaerolineae bacterium]|nr:right-handed parallel beta-helix repeat-containing protein [Anaerolineae bacterium]